MKESVLFVIALLMLSCSPKSKTNGYDERMLSCADTMQIDTIYNMEDFIYAQYFYVYQDSILIVANKQHSGVYFIEFYDFKTMLPISKCYRLGEGPDDMLNMHAYMNGNVLVVDDFGRNRIACVNMDSLMLNPSYYMRPVSHCSEVGTIVPYKDTYLAQNPYYFVEKSIGISQEGAYFWLEKDLDIEAERRKYKYYTSNVVGTRIIVNEEKNRVVCAYTTKAPEVNVYDMELNLLKNLRGPKELKQEYVVLGNQHSEKKSVIFRKRAAIYFYAYCIDDDYFYYSYMGDYIEGRKSEADMNAWIIKYDWDGNPVGCWFAGRCIYALSRSKSPNTFYVSTVDENKQPCLIKMTVP